MFYCYIHNWYSSENPCPACHKTVTTTLSTDVSDKETFTWTDARVQQFCHKWWGQKDSFEEEVAAFKQSKAPQPKEERITVGNVWFEDDRASGGGLWAFNTNKQFHPEKLPLIKAAIEETLNDGWKLRYTKEEMDEYAKEVVKGFFIWYSGKMIVFLEYIKDIRPSVTSNEIEERVKEFEGKPIEDIISLYINSLTK